MIIVGVEHDGCTAVKDGAILENIMFEGTPEYCLDQAVDVICSFAEEEDVFVCLVANTPWFVATVYEKLKDTPRLTFAREHGREKKLGIYVNSSMRGYAKQFLQTDGVVYAYTVVAAVGSMIANRYYAPASQSEQL